MTVVFLTRDQVRLYDVNPHLNQAPQPVSEVSYSLENFVDVFTSLKPRLKGNLRFLLSDNISYSTHLQIPISEKDERQYISSQLSSLFPESLGEKDWDYYQTSTNSEFRDVFVFAPVKPYKELIDQISNDLGLRIISLEPESVAITRHPSPIIGTALKKDIVGKDDDVLNLAPSISRQINFSWLLIPLFLIVFIFSNIYLFSIFSKKKAAVVPIVTTPIPTVVIPTVTPTPEIISIHVLNGTGVTGAAGKMGDSFKDLGYSTVTTGNTSPDFSLSKAIFKTQSLKDAIAPQVKTVTKIADNQMVIDNSIEYSVIFILGKN
jgi:hypothetical protein